MIKDEKHLVFFSLVILFNFSIILNLHTYFKREFPCLIDKKLNLLVDQKNINIIYLLYKYKMTCWDIVGKKDVYSWRNKSLCMVNYIDVLLGKPNISWTCGSLDIEKFKSKELMLNLQTTKLEPHPLRIFL